MEPIFFSKLDMDYAYYQVQLHPESRFLMPLITNEGFFQFCRSPLSLGSTPSAFSHKMDNILKGLSTVQHYFDEL